MHLRKGRRLAWLAVIAAGVVTTVFVYQARDVLQETWLLYEFDDLEPDEKTATGRRQKLPGHERAGSVDLSASGNRAAFLNWRGDVLHPVVRDLDWD